MSSDKSHESTSHKLSSLQRAWSNSHDEWIRKRANMLEAGKIRFAKEDPSLKEIFDFFATCRKVLASQLKHPDRVTLDRRRVPAAKAYGVLRTEGLDLDTPQPSLPSITTLETKGSYEDFLIELNKRYSLKEREWKILDPENENILSIIRIYKGNLEIIHTSVYLINEIFSQCDDLFSQLKSTDSLNERINCLAKIMWYLAHAMPCRAGSASISEMILQHILDIYITPLALQDLRYQHEKKLPLDLDAIFSHQDEFLISFPNQLIIEKAPERLTLASILAEHPPSSQKGTRPR